jgi:DNA-binding transcriptional MerR regulator
VFQIQAIPDKEYFTIGEVARIALVPKYTLRYWENSFKLLRPIRKTSGQRRYRKEEVEIVFKIKDLLYNKRYTIEGVKKCLVADKRKKIVDFRTGLNLELKPALDSKFLRDIRDELQSILKLLKKY